MNHTHNPNRNDAGQTPRSRAVSLIAGLLAALVFTVLPAPTAHAAAYVVNTLADNTTDDTSCTLREVFDHIIVHVR